MPVEINFSLQSPCASKDNFADIGSCGNGRILDARTAEKQPPTLAPQNKITLASVARGQVNDIGQAWVQYIIYELYEICFLLSVMPALYPVII